MTPAPAPEARLLVVDDEPSILELLSVTLRFAGFEVATATNGADALNKVRDFGPDLLVLDVMMPGLDGFAVASTLRGRGDQVPVVFLTAKDATEDRVQGLTIGGDDYVTKPFSLEEVVARVRSVLRRTSGNVLPAAQVAPTARLEYGDIVLDDDTPISTRPPVPGRRPARGRPARRRPPPGGRGGVARASCGAPPPPR
jgi:two-component system OmpR family response regulator